MNDTKQFINSIIIKALILIVVESIIIFIFFNDFIPIILGLISGGILNIIFFRIIYMNILYAIETTPEKSKKFMTINYIIRYIITGILLFVCAKSPYLNIFSCALGLFTIKLTLYINNVYSLVSEKKEKNSF